jgi:hypothetical protein
MPKSTRSRRGERVAPKASRERVTPSTPTAPVYPQEPGVRVDPDGRIQPTDDTDKVSTLPKDTDVRDDTASGVATGTVVGAGLGAVVGGPVGAVVGAVAGAAAGKVAEEANREDPNVPTGNPTDADSHRTKNDYFAGQIYEEGSLADVPIKRARDEHVHDEPDAAGHDRVTR